MVEADGGRLKLEWQALWTRPGDEVNDYCWLDGDRLLGFLGIYRHGSTPELAGMVDPAWRRRGVGTALLDAARAELARRDVADALVVCPRTPAGGAAFALARGGVAEHSEHALELRGDPTVGPPVSQSSASLLSLRPATPADAIAIRSLLRDGFGHEDATIADRLDTEDDHVVVVLGVGVIGYLRLSYHEADRDTVATGGVYGFAIARDHRGRGIGREVLRRCCLELIGRGAQRIGLEVATDNEHALGLYTSLGFEPVITEDYFRLSTSSR